MNGDPRSHGLWERTALPAPATRPLAGTVRADVAIVGGGFTGLSAALHLAEAGCSAVVLEAASVGFGGSGRNVGLVNAGLWIRPDEVPGRLGERHGERLLDLLGNGPGTVFDLVERHGIACEPVRTGTLHCAVGRAGLAEIRERARQWARRGAPVSLLDAAETARLVGSDAYPGALLDRRAGTIQPLSYARGLARAAMAAGATVHTDSPVQAAHDDGSTWRLVTPGGDVEAPQVIVATDAYTAGLWPRLRAEQIRLPYFNLATAPLAPDERRSVLPERHGAWDTLGVLSSFRLDAAGRLVFGSVGALRGTGLAVHRDWGRRALARLFPQLGRVSFETEWHGTIGLTIDDLPRIHRLGRGIVSVGGYNGRGIAPGTVLGRCLADLVRGALRDEDLPLPVTDPVPAGMKAAREFGIEAGAQLAHLVGARL